MGKLPQVEELILSRHHRRQRGSFPQVRLHAALALDLHSKPNVFHQPLLKSIRVSYSTFTHLKHACLVHEHVRVSRH